MSVLQRAIGSVMADLPLSDALGFHHSWQLALSVFHRRVDSYKKAQATAWDF